jgi:hypothetical protein
MNYEKVFHYFSLKKNIVLSRYRQIFSISEIESSSILQWFSGAMLLSFYVTFNGWISSSVATVESFKEGTHSCWSFFQTCGDWYTLSALPDGYSQTTLYMVLFGLMLLAVFYMWKGKWVFVHLLLSVLFLWKLIAMFLLSNALSGNYDYYHVVFTAILLLIPYKVFFLKLSFVLLYFLAATIKIDEGWILGSYFTSLKTGLPIFPDALTPLITNAVIFMQVVGAWFLLSTNKVLQRLALMYFIIFHLYSGVLVQYHYPAMVLPELLILFGPLTKNTIPLTKKSIFGWCLIMLMFFLQFISILIPGDERLTLEGNMYGLYMFEANHQCVSTVRVLHTDGSTSVDVAESSNARERCNPYDQWFRIQQFCKRDPSINRIEWQFDHSINGSPFYRIVDEGDACALEYRTLGHNTWIHASRDNSIIVGYPVKNIYK